MSKLVGLWWYVASFVLAIIIPFVRRPKPANQSLLEREAPFASYIRAMMANSIRTYATGIAVDGTKVTLYYGDRFGILASGSFDFMEEPDLLVLVVAALCNARATDLGFSPAYRIAQSDGKVAHSYCDILIPLAYGPHVNDNNQGAGGYWGGNLSGPYRFWIEENEARALLVDADLVGSGTTVIPLRMMRTVLYSGNPVDTGKKKLVWKFSYVHRNRLPEANTIRCVREGLKSHKPSVLKHVVKLVCASRRAVEAIGLPRLFLRETEDYSEKVFQSMVTLDYRPLRDLWSSRCFLQVFIQVVKGSCSCPNLLSPFIDVFRDSALVRLGIWRHPHQEHQ